MFRLFEAAVARLLPQYSLLKHLLLTSHAPELHSTQFTARDGLGYRHIIDY